MTTDDNREQVGSLQAILSRATGGKAPATCIVGGLAGQARYAEAFGGVDIFLVSLSRSSEYLLGQRNPDLLTQTEMVNHTSRICAVTALPVLVDCGSGFGNAINVRRTTSLIMKAGAAGILLSNEASAGQASPTGLVPVSECVGKLRAAIDSRNEQNPTFVVAAKSSARSHGYSLLEVGDRLAAYQDAGVDLLFAEGLKSVDEMVTLHDSLQVPMCGTLAPGQALPSLAQLSEAGMAVAVLDASAVSATAAWSILSLFAASGYDRTEKYMRDAEATHPAGQRGYADIVGFGQIRAWEQQYLDADDLAAKYQDSAANERLRKVGNL